MPIEVAGLYVVGVRDENVPGALRPNPQHCEVLEQLAPDRAGADHEQAALSYFLEGLAADHHSEGLDPFCAFGLALGLQDSRQLERVGGQLRHHLHAIGAVKGLNRLVLACDRLYHLLGHKPSEVSGQGVEAAGTA